jgi:hypothetical protein
VSVVCCQGEVSATGRSFVQRSRTERKRERESVCACACVCVCVIDCYQMQQSFSKRVTLRNKKVKCFCSSVEQSGTRFNASDLY